MPDPSTHLYRVCTVPVTLCSLTLWKCEVYTLVMTNIWSDSPLSVSGSYSTSDVEVFDKIRSTQDLSCPLVKVWRAGIPGCYPFKILQPYNSHLPIIHCALLLVIGSSVFLGICMSSIVGDKAPTLEFQSPQIIYAIDCWKLPRTSSIRLRVTFSSSPRFYKLVVGGI
jgi:hypothetical protein